MADYTLQASWREAKGKNKVDKLRAEGKIPAVLYLNGEETKSLLVNAREFDKAYGAVGTTSLLDLEFGDGKRTVLVKEVQRHPYRNDVLHIDFQGVRMDEKIKVMVPVNLLNRDEIRLQPSVLMQMVDEVEVECLPANIPAFAEADVENMQYGDVITVGDLDIAKDGKVEILLPLEEVVCTLSEPQEVSEEEETEEISAADVPEVGKEDETEE